MPERPDPALANFTAVENITGVPEASLPYAEILLNVKITPAGATNRRIFWSVETDGEATAELQGIRQNRLVLGENEGTITLTAVIKNGAAPGVDYTQEFEITVSY